MGVVICAAFRDADHFQHFLGLFKGLLLGHVLVKLYALADLVSDGHNGVQGRHGILEYHGDVVASHFFKLRRAHFQHVLAVEVYLAALDDAGRVRHEVEDSARRRRLARAGLTNKAESAALADLDADAVDGVNVGVLGLIVHHEIFQIKNEVVFRNGIIFFHIIPSLFLEFRIERVAQAVTQQVERKHG